MSVSREEQRKAAAERGRQNYESRNEGGFSGKRVIDLKKIGGFKKDLFFRPKDGTNRIDIIPYVIKTDRHPQKVKEGYTDYLLDLWVHRRVGPSESQFVCIKKMFGKACPICEELDELRKDPNVDDEEINALRPKRRVWYNVINLDVPERDQQIQIFEEAHFLFEKEVLEKAGASKGGFIPFWDIEEGRTIVFRASQKKSKKGNFYEYRIDEFEERPKYKESIYKETFSFDDIYVIPTYEEVRNAFHGVTDDEEEDEKSHKSSRKEQDEEEKPSHRSKRENDDDEERPARSSRREKDRNEEEEEKPSRRESRRSKDDDDEKPSRRQKDDDEDKPKRSSRRDEEEEEEPKSKKSSSKCPEGYEFGVDNDQHKECQDCDKDTWNACADEADRIEKEKKRK